MASMSAKDHEHKEVEGLLHDKAPTVNKIDDRNEDSHADRDGNIAKENDECKEFMKKDISDFENSHDIYESKKCRLRKMRVNKSLLAFRITQFLWFGAGSIPSIFLGIFLKQRGLTILELSSVFSMIFLFQFLTCFITGFITDKIGNAKPVLIFLMLSTSSVLVTMSLTPNVNSVSCTQNEAYLNNSNIRKSDTKFHSCYMDCLLKHNTDLSGEGNVTGNLSFEYALFVDNIESKRNSTENVCDFANFPPINMSLFSLHENCCISCANNTRIHCITVRKGYLVVVYAILILFFYSVWNTTYRFMNFTAIALASKHDSHFGKEYAIAKCGDLSVIIIVAFILNIDKKSGSHINFDPAIWVAAGIQFCAFLALFMSSVPIFSPGKNLTNKAFSLLRDIDMLAFVLVLFVAGNGFAFNHTFNLVFLETINAPSIVVALHSVASILFSFPTLLTSKWWLKKFGANKLFVLGLLFYAINNTVFSYVNNSWWILVIDICIAFNLYLFWAAVVVHCRDVAPVGFAATLNALAGAVHFGIGRSSGVFFGGMMINYMGMRNAYRIMAAIFFASALLYLIFIYKQRKSSPVIARNGTDTAETKISNDADVEAV